MKKTVLAMVLGLSLGCATATMPEVETHPPVVVRQMPLERVEMVLTGCEDEAWVVQGPDGEAWAAQSGSLRPTRRCSDSKTAPAVGPIVVETSVAAN